MRGGVPIKRSSELAHPGFRYRAGAQLACRLGLLASRSTLLRELQHQALCREGGLEHEPDDLSWRGPQSRSRRRSARRLAAATLSKPVTDAIDLPTEALLAQLAPEPGGAATVFAQTPIQMGCIVIDDRLANTRRRLRILVCVPELLHSAVVEVELPSEFSIGPSRLQKIPCLFPSLVSSLPLACWICRSRSLHGGIGAGGEGASSMRPARAACANRRWCGASAWRNASLGLRSRCQRSAT